MRVFLVAVILSCLIPVGHAFAQPFSYTRIENDLTRVNYSSLALGDIDHDGDLDAAYSGNIRNEAPFLPSVLVSKSVAESLVLDTWTHTFSTAEVGSGLWLGSVDLVDIDLDGNLDLFVTGTSSPASPFLPGATIFLGDGLGDFSPSSSSIQSLFAGASAWGDYDGDGDHDLLLTGSDESGEHQTFLYENVGGTLQTVAATFPGLAYGDAQWGDVDSDGDKDVLLVGATTDGEFISDIFVNDGTGQFAPASAGFTNRIFASADLGDYDADGDLDVVIGGGLLSPELFDSAIEVYRNDSGVFTPVATLGGGFYGQVQWGDHDNDGDLDLLSIGSLGGFGKAVARIYQNNGQDQFMKQVVLAGFAYSSAQFGDYDSDGDLDVLVSGLDVENKPSSQLYRNDQLLVNRAPSAPIGLASVLDGQTVTLSWQAGVDELTTDTGLSYAVRIGSAPGLSDVRSAAADPESGRRFLPRRGNVDVSNRTVLASLSPGTYYWSVQSVDNSFIGSPFADEQTFVVVNTAINTGIEDDQLYASELHDPYPNPMQNALTIPLSLSSGERAVVEVYSSIGRRVTTIDIESGGRNQEVNWNGLDISGERVASGLYFVRLQTQTVSHTKTFVVVR